MAEKAPAPAPAPEQQTRPTGSRFKVVAQSQEEEDNFDYVSERHLEKPNNMIEAIGHTVKGALGAGVLGGHVAYMKAGLYPALVSHVCFGLYITYCLHVLVRSVQILIRRTKVVHMSYPDAAEAAVACFPNTKVARLAKPFRYCVDFIICLDLFGACACYQIIIGKTIKQLVENTQITAFEGLLPGYPHLRVYMAGMVLPIILICLIRHLKWLAPFSIIADIFIVFCAGNAVYYSFQYNPEFVGMVPYTNAYSYLEYVGMSVFSMSAASVVVTIENNMKNPKRFPCVLVCAMSIIVGLVFFISFFGYNAFLSSSESPITVNFPLNITAKILKGCIATMVYVTHALNFFVPFNICFHYIRPKVKRVLMWEYIFRIIFVLIISAIAIAFPNINSLMGFLGAFCLSNMAFVWPSLIEILVLYQTGYGPAKWRLWKSLFLMTLGIFILFSSSSVNIVSLVKAVTAK